MSSPTASRQALNARALPVDSIAAADLMPLATLVLALVVVLLITGGAG